MRTFFALGIVVLLLSCSEESIPDAQQQLQKDIQKAFGSDIVISNLRVIDENSNDIEFDYKDLERQILNSVDY